MATSEKPTNVIPADHIPGPRQGEWTYTHYAALPDDGQRYEIIDGVLFMTPPSPSSQHQIVVVKLIRILGTYIEDTNLGQVFTAPLDVRLTYNMVVQPDVFVLLKENMHKLVAEGVLGGPDLVIEVSSPRTVIYDKFVKRSAYARSSVKEYWLVEPLAHNIEVLELDKDTYRSLGIFEGEQMLPSRVIPHLPVPVKLFFA